MWLPLYLMFWLRTSFAVQNATSNEKFTIWHFWVPSSGENGPNGSFTPPGGNHNATYVPLPFQPLAPPAPPFQEQVLFIEYDLTATTYNASDDGYDVYFLEKLLDKYANWISTSSVFHLALQDGYQCPTGRACSPFSECKKIYEAFLGPQSIIQYASSGWDSVLFAQLIDTFMRQSFDPSVNKESLWCPTILVNLTMYPPQYEQICDSPYYNLDSQKWTQAQTDENLEIFTTGGIDHSLRVHPYIIFPMPIELIRPEDTLTFGGFPWFGLNTSQWLASELKRSLGPSNTVVNCSLKNPCLDPGDCSQVGAYWMSDRPRFKSRWGFFALWAIRNLNQALTTQYNAMQGAAIDATLEAFNVDDYFPKAHKSFPLLNALTGLGILFGAVSGFLTEAAAVAGTIGTIAPAVGTYYERGFDSAVDRSDPNVAAKTYAKKLRTVYDAFVHAQENITADLFSGQSIGNGNNGSVTLLDVLKNGTWVDPDSVPDLASAQDQIFFELFSRSINAMWKTETSNKMWVLFVDLEDDVQSTPKCQKDLSGPQDLKYCADGGVYYVYNFIEKGDHQGYLGYPWGADKMLSNINLDPSVCGKNRSHNNATRSLILPSSGLCKDLLDHTNWPKLTSRYLTPSLLIQPTYPSSYSPPPTS